ncbi:MAG: ATP-binding protein [Gemmataceae bacterium]|nr:ATP-binding protein [Gemmataceae bacterium]
MNPTAETGAVPFTEVVIPSDTSEARRIQDDIEALVKGGGRASDGELFSVRLALEEALVNAIKHGNQMDRAKKVSVGYRLVADRLEVRIADEGGGFDPADVPDPTAIENLDRPCGRGLMLMRHYMSEVAYSERGNEVALAKVFRGAKR